MRAVVCQECYYNGKSDAIMIGYTEHLELIKFPYGQVISNINFATSNMTNDFNGSPMSVLVLGPTSFCWDDLEREYRLYRAGLYLKNLHDRLCRTPTIPEGGGTGGSGGTGGNQPTDRSDKELCDPEKFVGYGTSQDCYTGCEQILRNYGLTNYGSSTAVFQLLDKDSNKSGLMLYEKAIDCIDRHLNYNRPIIVGIDYEVGSGNHDGITDHFVVITGRGYDSSTNLYYYTYMETGVTGNEGYDTYTNRLISNPSTKDFYDSNPKIGPRYDVTHVRPNDGDTKGTTSQLN